MWLRPVIELVPLEIIRKPYPVNIGQLSTTELKSVLVAAAAAAAAAAGGGTLRSFFSCCRWYVVGFKLICRSSRLPQESIVGLVSIRGTTGPQSNERSVDGTKKWSLSSLLSSPFLLIPSLLSFLKYIYPTHPIYLLFLRKIGDQERNIDNSEKRKIIPATPLSLSFPVPVECVCVPKIGPTKPQRNPSSSWACATQCVCVCVWMCVCV